MGIFSKLFRRGQSITPAQALACIANRPMLMQASALDALIAPDYATRAGWYRETLWMPEGWPYSHPVQDVTADEKAIAAGLTSRSKLVLRRGEDPSEIDAEQAADNARADALGLVYTSDGRIASGAPAPMQVTTQEP